MSLPKAIGLILTWCGIVLAAPVIPRPTLNVENVTSYSITLTWTLPKNELFNEFIVEMFPEEGDVLDFNPKDMKRTFVNLTPGVLYTFVVRTVREESLSDPAEIKQDTVPLTPNDLQLRSFDTLVLTLEGPYFGDTEFTVETHGIEATWESPTSGESECYHAEIEASEGLEAIPGNDDEIVRGEQLRQYINLIPGKTYRVTVYSATCGEGHLGELRSDGISTDIRLPPAAPPAITVEEDMTTAELTWEEPPGFYDDFEIVQVDNQTSRMIIERPDSPSNLGRNISGLRPCTTYEVDVYTILDGEKSLTPRRATINTKPVAPTGVTVTDFTETSVSFKWDGPVEDILQDYLIGIASDFRNMLRTSENTATILNLNPGTQYSMSFRSICRQSDESTSTIITFTQATKPNPPELTTSECVYIGANESLKNLYEAVPWDAPDLSRINLTWEKPARTSWDRVLIDYSPFEFEEGRSTPGSPMLFGADQVSTTISIPVSGRVMSISVRTVSNNVYSDPTVRHVTCGGPDGEAVLRCRSYLLFWNIIITPIGDGSLLRVDLPNYPIHNATVYLDDLGEVLHFYNNTFFIRNPCERGGSSRITVYPRCPSILPFCPVITRPICVHKRGGRFEEFDACCNNRLYDTKDQICCHSKLLSKDTRTTEECCATKWYDRTSHKCCGIGETVSRSLNGTC